jgi:hypothetical protein
MRRGAAKATLAIALSLLSAGALRAVAIEAVAERSFTADDLTTLREYLDGRERTGRRTYYRSDAANRAGLYLITDLDTPLSELPKDATFVLDYVASDDSAVKTLSFPIASGEGNFGKAAYIGLTGPQFDGLRLVAWRLVIADASGNTLAQARSFLWEMPGK